MAKQVVNCGYFDGFKLGKKQKHFLWIAALAYAFEMIDGGMFNYATPVLQADWGLSLEKISTLQSLTFIGMFFGGLFGGWFADKVGRKWGLLISIGAFSAGSILTVFCQPEHIMTLEISRFLTGMGVVAQAVIGQVYIAEMMPKENRGRYQALTVASGTIFVPLSALLCKWILDFGGESWRWMFAIGGLSILMIPLGKLLLVESPRWLVQRGRYQEAEKVVEICVGVETDLSAQAAACANTGIGMLKTVQIMFSKAYIKRTLVVLVVCWGVLIGNTYTMGWIAALLSGLGMPLATIMTVMAVSQWGTPIGDYVCSFVAEKGGRKGPIVVFCMVTGLCYIGIGIVKATAVAFAILYFLRCVFGNGATTMMWNYTAENYPNAIRSSANGILMGSGRLIVAASMVTIPIFINVIGYTGIMAINGLLYIIPAFIVLLMGTKTANVSLEELEITE